MTVIRVPFTAQVFCSGAFISGRSIQGRSFRGPVLGRRQDPVEASVNYFRPRAVDKKPREMHRPRSAASFG